jgi:Protein of unknown function (DUF1573)
MSTRTVRRSGAVLAVAVLALGAVVLAQAAKPRAVFKETSHDFGKVKQGDAVSHEFVFKNAGGALLVIDRVDVTCGCTAAVVSDKTIPPGGEGKIKMTFDSRGYSGRVAKYIYLVSNDSESSRRELSLVATIEVPPSARIDVDSYNVDMGVILEGETASATIVIRSGGEKELKVEMVQEGIEFYSGGKPLVSPFYLPSGEAREVEMRFPAQVKIGNARDYVLIKSNDPVRSTLSVYVSRYVITKKELKDLFERYRSFIKGS